MNWLKRLAILLAATAAPAATHAQRAQGPVGESGVLAGAPYRIDVPARWQGGLVVLYHGYHVTGEAEPNPYRALGGTEAFLQRGYAVIQSGYSRQGWAVAEALADTRRLRAEFERRFGRPDRTFVAGFSMGGHLALTTLEREPARYDGALTLCGVNLPAPALTDRAIADLAAARTLFPATIPDLARGGAVPTFNPERFAQALAAEPAAAERLARWAEVRPAELPARMWLYYVVIRELRERAGGFPGSNAAARYTGFGDDAAFNRNVRRYRADAAALPYVRANATLTGRIADPVVVLDNVYDELVPPSTRTVYPAAVRRAGRSRLLTILPPAGDGHCNFTLEQIGAAFDRLTVQVAGSGRTS